jgi:serine/threonine protein kinase
MQHPFHLMPDMMVGPFRIHARLGAGGFGAVFRVECEGEPYALKFAVHGPDSEDLNHTDARAQRELACLLLVSHPNVVRVWAHGRWPHPRTGYHYVVMDYVEGLTLTEWVKQTRPPLRQVLRLFDTLALTLDALHSQAIHHRDLKGSNILVRTRDGEPVLVDFGAGEHTGSLSLLTEGPLPPGTPHLRTPEALRFHRERYADPTARYPFQPTDDLYALGATLYEVLAGAPAFPPTLPREVLTALIEKELPPSPAVLNPQVPPALGKLVLRLLAKNPTERPASGRALHELFQALLHDDSSHLEVPLSPGAHAATTEGMGGPAVMSSADHPERPLSGPEDWGGTHASPGPTSLSEGSVPAGPAERASPGSPWHQRRTWLIAASTLALAVLGAVLGWAGVSATSRPGAPASQPVATSSEPPAPLVDPELPPASLPGDEGPPLHAKPPGADAGPSALARPLPDAGPLAVARGPSPSPPQKGSTMRPSPLDQPPNTPPPPAKPRSPGSSSSSALTGMVAACALAGGCATADPAVRVGPPPPQQCPPGAEESMKAALGTLRRAELQVLLPGATVFNTQQDLIVTEGRQEAVIFLTSLPGEGYPAQTRLIGDFYVRDKLYARFFAARLPNGALLPFCGYLAQYNDLGEGVSFLPSSKPGAMKVYAIQLVGYMTLDY